MKLKEMGIALVLALTITMALNVASVKATPGDVNGDGVVDIFDIVAVGLAFNSTPGDLHWNPNADLNSDQVVDIFDLVIVAVHFGETA